MNSDVKDYYIGLDIGTNSVGWAVTDLDYNLIRKRGKDMWGSYLFDEAQTAADRRQFRTGRRRQSRRHQRLMLLQGLFEDEIGKVDPDFFLRLNNSAFAREDKDPRLAGRDSLFRDRDFKDKDYFKKYPTIYHLRSALVHGEDVEDIRLVYLAVHHILKHRGHFLFESQTFNIEDSTVIHKSFSDMNAWIQEGGAEAGMETLETDNLEAVVGELSNAKHGKKDKCQSLQKIYGLKSGGRDPVNNSKLNILKAVTGSKFSLKSLFIMADDFACETDDVSFDSEDFEDNVMPGIENGYGDDMAEFVRILKSIYDWSVLSNVMKGHAFISDAKVETYEKHGEDLAALKAYVKENCPEKFSRVFNRVAVKRGSDKVCNYAAYIGMDSKKGFAKCSKEDFYKFLKSDIKVTDEKILADMDNGTFMPLQSSKDNASIPYQVHLKELEAILDNAAKQFPFLSEKEGELTVSEKIVMLMTFRVPYYVGPLKGDFSWAKFIEGKEGERVTPWNFDEVIDKDGCEDAFIDRMKSSCSYLPDQEVLPAASFLYSEYAFLNELNNLKINGVKDEKVRQFIYEYAKTHKKVTLGACCKAMIARGILPKGTKKEQFTGIDEDFKNSLASYNDFVFLGSRRDTHPEMCEDIIKWITVISDKTRLISRIKENYGRMLSDDEIKRLSKLNYTKWGRLSRELLAGIRSPKCVNDCGEFVSIIDKMREGSENFMEIYYNYGFDEVVKERNQDLYSDKVTYSSIKEMYCSPSVKRSIWRSVELVREIVNICGGQPRKIFIEMGRAVNDGSRTGDRKKSRKSQVQDFYKKSDLYKSIQLEAGEWQKEIETTPDSKFDSDRLYLYYLQCGRCMYSGKEIKLEDVFNKNICDIDHIYPQSKIKDDSLNNRVLVLRSANQAKEDVYPISADIRSGQRQFWENLLNLGMISQVKFSRLVRSTPLSREELADFINRQLTFTYQSTKAVAETMQKLLPGSEVVYAKARNANDFKQESGIIKIRDLNDLHHAKDAYINIVVGNVFNTKFGHDAAVYFKQQDISSFNLKKLYDNDINGAWSPSYRERIVRTAEKDTCNVVHMVNAGGGSMFDQQIVPAGTNDGLIPIKDKEPFNDTGRYGGYNKPGISFFMLVRSLDKHGKPMLTIEGYPLHYEKRFGNSTDEKIRYCVQILKLKNPEIVLDNIKTGTLVCRNGSYVTIRGKTNNSIILCNDNQLHLDRNSAATLKEVCKYMDTRSKYRKNDLPIKDSMSSEDLLSLYDVFTEKLAMPMYNNLWPSADFSKLLKDGRTIFTNLTREQQAALLYEILHLFQCKPQSLANLTIIGGAKLAGSLKLNKNITGQSIKFIFQSPTGYYARIVNVKDLL
ncbi:MAG: type II CRISPR RNA-guided endonuclease Cas9 [Clostridia bacterium]|nr:type II CRISPR RNA-guided endonuclease Cas9 [Clostridia bacterium]